ncbi:hypothetical protein BC833DRAFT_562250 [Globomyces pollinis-pini]|nr:hypothetical protein BC833DRAFT_562250 [Globomyces pollinis-pini]
MVKMLLALLLAFVGLAQAGLADNATNYNFQLTLYQQNDYKFSFLWNVTKNVNNTNKDYLDGMLLFQSNTVKNISSNWISIGFGEGMLDAEFIFARSSYNTTKKAMDYRVSERLASGKYGGPIAGQNILSGTKTETNSSITAFVFRRPMDPDNGSNRVLKDDQTISLLWAFIVDPVQGVSIHEVNQRGGYKMILSSGSALPATLGSFTKKLLHGVGMMVVWLILFPFGAFYARYARSIQGWLVVKVSTQVFGSILVLAFLFLAYIATNFHLNNPHFWIGLVILGVTFLQMGLGSVSLLGFSNEAAAKWRDFTRIFHRFAGFGVMILAFVQLGIKVLLLMSGIGIDMCYPIDKYSTNPLWIMFFIAVTFWSIAFIAAEIYYRMKVFSYKPVNSTEAHQAKQAILPDEPDFEKRLITYTWESLDQAVKNGNMFVVANSCFVYDISTWSTSHPGGRLILETVLGTDITNEFYDEAGFDVNEFIPKPTLPERSNKAKRQANSVLYNDNASVSSMNQSSAPDSLPFTQRDCVAIQRARRSYRHSRLAIKKLSNMLVGKIDDHSSSMITLDGEEIVSSPNEYRRYALTKHQVLSSGAKPVFLVRFCAIYPQQQRNVKFRPGHTVEIQVRLSSGERVSRYYAPVSGDMDAFEIFVTVEPNGKLSNFLFHERVGERQFKIRGPVGIPIFPEPTLSGFAGLPETIYYFSGETGITSCLQIITNIFLTINVPVKVTRNFVPENADECALNAGDKVKMLRHYFDGWCYGVNLRTSQEGFFPVNYTQPFGLTKLIVIDIGTGSDIMGYELINGARIAFPHLVELHSFDLNTLRPEVVGGVLTKHSTEPQVIVSAPPMVSNAVRRILNDLGHEWIPTSEENWNN